MLGEFIGTALLLILGGGVNANVVLKDTKGQNSGWLVICFGWAMAVFLGVYASNKLGGSGHINPAVTVAFALFNNFDKSLLLPYLAGQFAGAFTGALLVWAMYKPHIDRTPANEAKLAVFSTAPAIRNYGHNFLVETIASFVLVFGALSLSSPVTSLGSLDALPVALLVLGIGLSLGGPTGYAINPARDLSPRIAHAILPFKKGNSDWSYAWVPVLGPIAGGIIAALVYTNI